MQRFNEASSSLGGIGPIRSISIPSRLRRESDIIETTSTKALYPDPKSAQKVFVLKVTHSLPCHCPGWESPHHYYDQYWYKARLMQLAQTPLDICCKNWLSFSNYLGLLKFSQNTTIWAKCSPRNLTRIKQVPGICVVAPALANRALLFLHFLHWSGIISTHFREEVPGRGDT